MNFLSLSDKVKVHVFKALKVIKMTMQQTPLLMSRILHRGAILDPNVEIVTLRNNGTHRQTLKTTSQRVKKLAN